ncbi:hypothetical protein [Pseudodesulfovibrio pelocollis]|nr:hypothetical protein [Pseudodesulfovibrio sp. SB368]
MKKRQHILNPLHVYCRLRSFLPCRAAKAVAWWWELIVCRFIY